MLATHGRTIGKAVLLGGAATAAALCACLTLAGVVAFCVAIATFDDYPTDGSEWRERMWLGAAAVGCCSVSLWFGWRVATDGRRGAR
jgi:hypothetical protein